MVASNGELADYYRRLSAVSYNYNGVSPGYPAQAVSPYNYSPDGRWADNPLD